MSNGYLAPDDELQDLVHIFTRARVTRKDDFAVPTTDGLRHSLQLKSPLTREDVAVVASGFLLSYPPTVPSALSVAKSIRKAFTSAHASAAPRLGATGNGESILGGRTSARAIVGRAALDDDLAISSWDASRGTAAAAEAAKGDVWVCVPPTLGLTNADAGGASSVVGVVGVVGVGGMRRGGAAAAKAPGAANPQDASGVSTVSHTYPALGADVVVCVGREGAIHAAAAMRAAYAGHDIGRGFGGQFFQDAKDMIEHDRVAREKATKAKQAADEENDKGKAVSDKSKGKKGTDSKGAASADDDGSSSGSGSDSENDESEELARWGAPTPTAMVVILAKNARIDGVVAGAAVAAVAAKPAKGGAAAAEEAAMDDDLEEVMASVRAVEALFIPAATVVAAYGDDEENKSAPPAKKRRTADAAAAPVAAPLPTPGSLVVAAAAAAGPAAVGTVGAVAAVVSGAATAPLQILFAPVVSGPPSRGGTKDAAVCHLVQRMINGNDLTAAAGFHKRVFVVVDGAATAAKLVAVLHEVGLSSVGGGAYATLASATADSIVRNAPMHPKLKKAQELEVGGDYKGKKVKFDDDDAEENTHDDRGRLRLSTSAASALFSVYLGRPKVGGSVQARHSRIAPEKIAVRLPKAAPQTHGVKVNITLDEDSRAQLRERRKTRRRKLDAATVKSLGGRMVTTAAGSDASTVDSDGEVSVSDVDDDEAAIAAGYTGAVGPKKKSAEAAKPADGTAWLKRSSNKGKALVGRGVGGAAMAVDSDDDAAPRDDDDASTLSGASAFDEEDADDVDGGLSAEGGSDSGSDGPEGDDVSEGGDAHSRSSGSLSDAEGEFDKDFFDGANDDRPRAASRGGDDDVDSMDGDVSMSDGDGEFGDARGVLRRRAARARAAGLVPRPLPGMTGALSVGASEVLDRAAGGSTIAMRNANHKVAAKDTGRCIFCDRAGGLCECGWTVGVISSYDIDLLSPTIAAIRRRAARAITKAGGDEAAAAAAAEAAVAGMIFYDVPFTAGVLTHAVACGVPKLHVLCDEAAPVGHYILALSRARAVGGPPPEMARIKLQTSSLEAWRGQLAAESVASAVQDYGAGVRAARRELAAAAKKKLAQDVKDAERRTGQGGKSLTLNEEAFLDGHGPTTDLLKAMKNGGVIGERRRDQRIKRVELRKVQRQKNIKMRREKELNLSKKTLGKSKAGPRSKQAITNIKERRARKQAERREKTFKSFKRYKRKQGRKG